MSSTQLHTSKLVKKTFVSPKTKIKPLDPCVTPWPPTSENVPDTEFTLNGEEMDDAKLNAQPVKNTILVDLLAPQAASTQKPNVTKPNVSMVATVHSTLMLTTENALPENNVHVSTAIKFSKPENDFDETVTNVSV
jgi:hypothetical protein